MRIMSKITVIHTATKNRLFAKSEKAVPLRQLLDQVHLMSFVWNYCVPIYACLLVVLFVRLPVFWLYYIGHGL